MLRSRERISGEGRFPLLRLSQQVCNKVTMPSDEPADVMTAYFRKQNPNALWSLNADPAVIGQPMCRYCLFVHPRERERSLLHGLALRLT